MEEFFFKYNELKKVRSEYIKDEYFRNKIKEYARKYLGKELGNCPNCYEDTYMLLRIKLKRGGLMNKLFEVKKGVVVGTFGVSGVLSFGASDEVCVKFLKRDKRFIRFFSKYPKNWEELIEDVPRGTTENEQKKRGRGRKKKGE